MQEDGMEFTNKQLPNFRGQGKWNGLMAASRDLFTFMFLGFILAVPLVSQNGNGDEFIAWHNPYDDRR